MKEWLTKTFWTGYSWFERIFLVSMLALQVIVFCITPDTPLAIFAQLLMVRRYREQWLWWLVIDVLCIKMWFVAGNWSMVAMYIAWTANCIYGWVNWTKLNKKQRDKSSEHVFCS